MSMVFSTSVLPGAAQKSSFGHIEPVEDCSPGWRCVQTVGDGRSIGRDQLYSIQRIELFGSARNWMNTRSISPMVIHLCRRQVISRPCLRRTIALPLKADAESPV